MLWDGIGVKIGTEKSPLVASLCIGRTASRTVFIQENEKGFQKGAGSKGTFARSDKKTGVESR